MTTNYLIRLDDACPYMDAGKWQQIEDILDRYGIKPLVGIIPANADSQTKIEPEDILFWKKAENWQSKGWEVALHGYDHVCISDGGLGGANPIWRRSEFAGVPLDLQREKIRRGIAVLHEHGIEPKYFFAPSHTFDKTTLKVLKEETDIRIVSDTIALKPYKDEGFLFIPQIIGHCAKMLLPGIYTFCFHPNTMNNIAFEKLEAFLTLHNNQFIGFDDLETDKYGSKRTIDRLLSWVFFRYRHLRGLK